MVSEELTREFFHTRDERLIRKLSEISQVISYKRGEGYTLLGRRIHTSSFLFRD